jgi:hypothetical protein
MSQRGLHPRGIFCRPSPVASGTRTASGPSWRRRSASRGLIRTADPWNMRVVGEGVAVPSRGVAPDDLAGEQRSFARVRAGRIVEVHVRRLADRSDVELLRAQVKATLRLAGPGPVICADHRLASLQSWDAADTWSKAMRGSGSGVVRSGLLLDPANAMYNLQIERVVQRAGNPVLRLFADFDELREWVGEVLAEHEREALRNLFSDA